MSRHPLWVPYGWTGGAYFTSIVPCGCPGVAVLRQHPQIWDCTVQLSEQSPGIPQLIGYVVAHLFANLGLANIQKSHFVQTLLHLIHFSATFSLLMFLLLLS